MRASLIIAAHNESDRLWRTVASCVETSAGLDCEIVVADDASWDDSVEETLRRFPQVRVVRHDERKGASPTKDLGARHARGEVLVFLDGHTKPEPGAIQRLIEDVERLNGDALVTPAVTGLCVTRWKTLLQQTGHGYSLELERLDCAWLPLNVLRQHPHRGRLFYESPALIGCAFAVHRELYDDLRGFDPHMLCWGVEDLDFGLKCWLMGHPILHDPQAVIGHRFQQRFDNFEVPVEQLIVNQLRMARKNFTEAVWSDWLARCRARNSGALADHPEGLWARVWELFGQLRPSAEQERAHLLARRVHDEFWYAERFGLAWPKLQAGHFEPGLRAFEAGAADPSPSPSPSPSPPQPCDLNILRIGIIDPETNTERTDFPAFVMRGESLVFKITIVPAIANLDDFCRTVEIRSFAEEGDPEVWKTVDLSKATLDGTGTKVTFTLSTDDLVMLGLIPTNEPDDVNEFASGDSSDGAIGPSNALDSNRFDTEMVFDGRKPRGKARKFGTFGVGEDQTVPPMIRRFCIAAGVLFCQIRCHLVLSKRLFLQNQADIFYISSHGLHSNGAISMMDGVSLLAADTKWGLDLDRVFVAGCSVFDIGDKNNNYLITDPQHTASPGQHWIMTGPKTFLGYCWTAPLDNNVGDANYTAQIIQSYAAMVRGGLAENLAWSAANRNVAQAHLDGAVLDHQTPKGRPMNCCFIDLNPTPRVYYCFIGPAGGPYIWVPFPF